LKYDFFLLKFRCINSREGSLNRGSMTMLSMFVIAILGGMVGLVLYELIEEVRGGTHQLHDHYHE
jgi:hypothetical protein